MNPFNLDVLSVHAYTSYGLLKGPPSNKMYGRPGAEVLSFKTQRRAAHGAMTEAEHKDYWPFEHPIAVVR